MTHMSYIAETHKSSNRVEHATRMQNAKDIPQDFVNLTTFVVSKEMIIAVSRKLKDLFSSGPDGVSAVVFRHCAVALAKPLAMISTRLGKFPTLWKESYMFSIFKSGDCRDVKNFRGIFKKVFLQFLSFSR